MNSTAFLEAYRPRFPYSTDNPRAGMYKHSREKAIHMRFIEANVLNMKNMMVFDIDVDNAQSHVNDAVAEGTFPMYSWLTSNPDTSHAQVGITIHGFARSKHAQDYFQFIRKGLTEVISGDEAYTNHSMRNPLHEKQITEWGDDTHYNLSELRDFIPADWTMKKPVPLMAESSEVFAINGRNDMLFRSLATYAYRRRLSITDDNAFFRSLEERAFEINLNFGVGNQLSTAEVNQIVKSIFGWDKWDDFTPEAFSRIQSARAKKRWKDTSSERIARHEAVLAMKSSGFTDAEIAENLSTTISNAKYFVREAKKYAKTL